MGVLIQQTYGNYTNRYAIEYVIRYITRTRRNEDRKNELICYGGIGVGSDPETMIRQFKVVQCVFRDRDNLGRKLFHETFSLTLDEWDAIGQDIHLLSLLANDCAYQYYLHGFQSVYAIHISDSQGLHIHLVGNAVSYINGKKWHSSFADLKERERVFNDILNGYQQIAANRLQYRRINIRQSYKTA